ncbi:unnamed protein product [Clavelina lepadiformis]|uniref:H(+)-exporting diphosphatase n=1 Tax=Clavelina lepadiformis TaxID=159417 RepID=A0ABP0FUB4_CLALP
MSTLLLKLGSFALEVTGAAAIVASVSLVVLAVGVCYGIYKHGGKTLDRTPEAFQKETDMVSPPHTLSMSICSKAAALSGTVATAGAPAIIIAVGIPAGIAVISFYGRRTNAISINRNSFF